MNDQEVPVISKRTEYKVSLAVGTLVSLGGNVYFRLAPSLISAALAMVGDVMVLYSSVWWLWVVRKPRSFWTGRGVAAVLLGLLLAAGITLVIGVILQVFPAGSSLVNP